MTEPHSYTAVPTAMGVFNVGLSPRGVVALARRLRRRGSRAKDRDLTYEAWHAARFGVAPQFEEVAPDDVARAIAGHAVGDGTSRTSVDLGSCGPFQRSVLDAAAEITPGEVQTYGAIARRIGSDRAARAVGTALARNPVPLLVPCHRVVPASGGVGGYALGSEVKQALLDLERTRALATP